MRLMLVDDEPNVLLVLKDLFSDLRSEIITANDLESAKQALFADQPEVVLCDLRLGEHSGLELLRVNQSTERPAKFIFLTAHGDVETAVKALKNGAIDFLIKPAEEERLLSVVKNAFHLAESEERLSYLEEEVGRLSGGTEFVAQSPSLVALKSQAEKLAKNLGPVLIVGESGTGKELLARTIHKASGRASGPFVALNCSALSLERVESELFGHEKGAFPGADSRHRGKFELADGGTLFLDEVGDLPAALQSKLLRVLEDGKIERVGSERALVVDARIIAATNRDLELAVEHGEFRLDLLHRLNTFVLRIPALCERREDIKALSEHFLGILRTLHARPKLSLSTEAINAMESYHWPGNARELRNVMERAAVMTVGDEIGAAALALNIDENVRTSAAGLDENLRNKEREIIVEALKRNNWIQARAARDLGLNRSHLHYKIRRLGIVIPKS